MRVLGYVALAVVTLATAAVAGYLLLYPPGAVDASVQGQDLTSLLAPTPTATATPEETTPTTTPPPQLSLTGACDAALPVLERLELLNDDYVGGEVEIVPQRVIDLSRDLAGIRDLSPIDLATAIDPLVATVDALTSTLDTDQPTLNVDDAAAAIENLRNQCAEA